jgi:hypothetical protein
VIDSVVISIYERGVSSDHRRLSSTCSHGQQARRRHKSLGSSQAADLLQIDQPELAIPFDASSPRRTTHPDGLRVISVAGLQWPAPDSYLRQASAPYSHKGALV